MLFRHGNSKTLTKFLAPLLSLIEIVVLFSPVALAAGRSFKSNPVKVAVSAPNANGLVTTFLLTSTQSGMLPFTTGLALKQGDVPSGLSVRADVSNFQAVVKNRWPDGSMKYAIISGRADLVSNVSRSIAISTSSVIGGLAAISTTDLKATGITASLQFGNVGTVSWANGDWDSFFQSWISGPEMSSWIYRKSIGSDPHLVAWLEVRCFQGGRVEVLPWIENGYLNVAGPSEKIATTTFTLGGTQRFSQSLDLRNHQRAVLASGSTLTHWHGGDPQVVPRLNTTYLMATKLVPNYRSISSTSAVFGSLASSYTPLAQANYSNDMGSAGYQSPIGLLPEWDAAYLASGGDPRAYRAVLINHMSAGRYGVHYRDETTNRPFRFSNYPNLVMADGSGVISIGASSKETYTPATSGATAPGYDSPHHPSIGYFAYLISGWNYFLEESQFVATTNFLKQNDTSRQFTKGILETSVGANTPRGAAWALRTLSQAATISVDGDPLRDQLVASLNENIMYYHNRYVTIANNPLGLVQPYEHYSSSGPWQSAIWQDDFFTATFGYMKDQQAYSLSVTTQLNQFLTWKYRSIVGRLGGNGANEMGFPYAAQYVVNYSPLTNADWDTGKGPWYANWGEVARAMAIPVAGVNGAALVAGYPEEATSYWGNLMPAISYAVDHGAVGADLSWARITGASNYPLHASKYNDQPVWAVIPRGK